MSESTTVLNNEIVDAAEDLHQHAQLYLNSQAGLANESLVRSGTTEPGLERSIADAHYAVQAPKQTEAGRPVCCAAVPAQIAAQKNANRRHRTD